MTVQRHTRWKLGATAFVVVLVILLFGLRDSLLPLFIAFGLAYAFDPVVDRLERRGVPRTATVLGVLVILIGLLSLLLATLIPALASQMQGFVQDFPQLLSTAVRRVSDFAANYGIVIPGNVNALVDRVQGLLHQGSMQGVNKGVAAAAHVLSSVAGVLLALLNFVIVPIFFFYVCRDLRKARSYVYRLIPPRRQPYAKYLYDRVDGVFAGYIRGQLVVASILAVVFSIGLLILKVRFGLFIGILAGFLNVIPYVGQFTGLALSVLMALVDFDGVGKIIGIVALFAVTNFLEGNFITPKIVGDKVGLSPLWAIVALLIGGRLAGFGGMLIAVPTAGVIKVLLGEVVLKYKSSAFYRDPLPAPLDGVRTPMREEANPK